PPMPSPIPARLMAQFCSVFPWPNCSASAAQMLQHSPGSRVLAQILSCAAQMQSKRPSVRSSSSARVQQLPGCPESFRMVHHTPDRPSSVAAWYNPVQVDPVAPVRVQDGSRASPHTDRLLRAAQTCTARPLSYSLARGASRALSCTHAPAASASPSPARTGLRSSASHALVISRARHPPPSLRVCVSSIPKPARLRSPPALLLHSRAHARAPLSLPYSRTSQPPPRLLPTLDAPAPFSRSSASSRVPSTPVPKLPTAHPRAPSSPRVLPVPVACSPADACHSPISQTPSTPLLPLDPVGSTDGRGSSHGSHPSDP
ncbi:Unknown protein, partial [Striga hermonthica]